MNKRSFRAGDGSALLLMLLVLAISLSIAGELAVQSVASASQPNARDEPQGTGASAAIEFDAYVYPLFNKQIVLPPSPTSSEHRNDEVLGEHYFAELAATKRTTSDSAVTYAVEELHDRGLYQICSNASSSGQVAYDSGKCEDVLIGVRSIDGRMYFYFDDGGMAHRAKYRHAFKMEDFEPQRAEVSAQESSGSLKIYRDILVTPPDRTPDCSDYPTRESLRYSCLFLGELLPQTLPGTTTTLTNGLPDALTQAKSNYRLVLSEEFEGTPGGVEGDACRNGMTLIDEQIWTYDATPCDGVDADGVTCENVANGRLSHSVSRTCGSGLSSKGKFAFKYGYFEYQYSFNLKYENSYMNAAMVIGDSRSPERMIFPRYGLAVRSYEDMLKIMPIEIDVTEYNPRLNLDYSHRNLNNPDWIDDPDFPRRDATRNNRFCVGLNRLRVRDLYFGSLTSGCSRTADGGKGSRVTVTKGVEWTPAGYRYFIKVHGATSYNVCRHAVGSTLNSVMYSGDARCAALDILTKTVPASDFILLDPAQLYLTRYEKSFWSNGDPRWTRIELTSDEISTFIATHTDNILLEQFAVSHVPLDIGSSMWSFGGTNVGTTINVEAQYEYIRVYQPKDHYTQMEPVYK